MKTRLFLLLSVLAWTGCAGTKFRSRPYVEAKDSLYVPLPSVPARIDSQLAPLGWGQGKFALELRKELRFQLNRKGLATPEDRGGVVENAAKPAKAADGGPDSGKTGDTAVTVAGAHDSLGTSAAARPDSLGTSAAAPDSLGGGMKGDSLAGGMKAESLAVKPAPGDTLARSATGKDSLQASAKEKADSTGNTLTIAIEEYRAGAWSGKARLVTSAGSREIAFKKTRKGAQDQRDPTVDDIRMIASTLVEEARRDPRHRKNQSEPFTGLMLLIN